MLSLLVSNAKKCRDIIDISDLLEPNSNRTGTMVFRIQYHHGSETIPVIASLTLANADTVSIVRLPA